MKVARRSIALLPVYMDGRSIFIDDQRCGVPTTAVLQSLQTDDSIIGVGRHLSVIVKSVFANPDIAAIISGGIMRMNGLCLRLMFRLSSHRFISSLAMAFSRFASSMQRLQGALMEHEMSNSMPCSGSSTVRSGLSTPQFLQIISFLMSRCVTVCVQLYCDIPVKATRK